MPTPTARSPDHDTAVLSEREGPLSVRAFGLTHPGRVRPNNEDQFLIAELTKALKVHQASVSQPKMQFGADRGHLFMVADGMGGHAAGEQASALAVDAIEVFVLDSFKWFLEIAGPEGEQLRREFHEALSQADQHVLAEAERHPELHGMGATLIVAFTRGEHLFTAHAGDCRAYLCREGYLQRLTRDHTVAEELAAAGQLAAEEISHHRFRHVVTSAVGGHGKEAGIRVAMQKVRLQAGDRLLLCSDGLTDMLADEEIAAVLDAYEDPREACPQLISRANEHGGRDNITVIVVNFEGAA